MADRRTGALATGGRANWVRLRTIIVLRWIAIGGQVAAITVAERFFDLKLEIGLAVLAIGASIIANLVAIFIYPQNKRLTEGEVALHLVFDITQLAFLLFLTGGLNNPFALLMLVPVAVSATALGIRTTLAIGVLSILLVTLLVWVHTPLRTEMGFIIRMPNDLVFGFWVALVIGIIFLSAFAQRVTSEVYSMSDALAATQMALAREQKLTDLGGVVAAAAHELGTPLATIKLVSSELRADLAEHPELREDVELIAEQADRCRDILRSMGRAGKDDLHLKSAPLGAVIREAADPHGDRGIRINYDLAAFDGADTRQPMIYRRPEVIHGLRNLIQNAVDFAQSDVWIDVRWDDRVISVRIIDDGPGFPAGVIGRLGDPFLRSRASAARDRLRPGYEGMGLGLFIAKTLLERSGAELTFMNGADGTFRQRSDKTRSGAIVESVWPRGDIAVEDGSDSIGLGENRQIEI